MFFYRPWSSGGLGGLGGFNSGPDLDPFNDQLFAQFRFHRWGYAGLLGLTIVASLVLNLGFLLSFVGSSSIRQQPHWAFLFLAVRDLLVTLILIPSAIDWFVTNFGMWSGGMIWCKAAGFVEFTLAFEYPLLLIAIAFILYTRSYGPPEGLDLPMQGMDEVDQFDDLHEQSMPLGGGGPPSQQQRQHSRPPSVANSFSTPKSAKPPGFFSRSAAPSVSGSVDGYRHPPGGARGRGFGAQPFYITPNRAGSVTGSIEGRMAAGRMMGARGRGTAGPRANSSMDGSRLGSRPGSAMKPPQHSQLAAVRGQHGFRTSSPLYEVDETNCSIGEAADLWDAASLDYPGREFESPQGWDIWDSQTTYTSLHMWTLSITWLIALGLGIAAALMMEHDPNRRPGCSIPVNPFVNPHSQTVTDPGFNFVLSFVILDYVISAAALVLLLVLICWLRMADKRFRTYVKMLITLTCVFVVSRSPVDIIQLKGLIDAARGFHLKDPFGIEQEIVLIWVTYIPLVLNPVIYFSFLSEYRRGTIGVLAKCCGCRVPENEAKASRYKEDETINGINASSKVNNEKTQVTNIL